MSIQPGQVTFGRHESSLFRSSAAVATELTATRMYPELGLTSASFFESLPDESLRRFIDPRILAVLDALFGGQIDGRNLYRVALALIDLHAVLGDAKGRQLVLELVPEPKRAELEARVERRIDPALAQAWSEPEVGRLRDFFGLVEERLTPTLPPTTDLVAPAYGLFGHQRRAIHELLPLLAEGDRRAVLHLPTGVGKTRTAMHVVATFLSNNDPSVVVWLASGKELLEQAAHEFKEAWSHLGTRPVQIGLIQGQHVIDFERFSDGFLAVGLAKAWSMLSRSHPEWTMTVARSARLVVFDEAHQSIARTYSRITDELTTDYRCALLGLTATPGRTWDDIDEDGKLADFYDHNKVTIQVPGDNPIRYLIDNGYLARPVFRTLLAKPGLAIDDGDLARIASSLDIPDDVLSNLSMTDQYVAAALEAIEDLLSRAHTRVLVFAASVELAHVLTAVLTARGIAGYAVTGLTTDRARTQAIRAFKSDVERPIILVNFGVLTTGFDAPKATAAVIARPTKSLVLYSQMIGRAIRGPRAGGTKACEVVTVVDTRLPGFGDVAEAFSNWEDVWS